MNEDQGITGGIQPDLSQQALNNLYGPEEFQKIENPWDVEYDALKEKVAAQEETIRHLRNLLNKEGNPHTDIVLGFAELVQKQTSEFQNLLTSMGKAIDVDKPGNQNDN